MSSSMGFLLLRCNIDAERIRKDNFLVSYSNLRSKPKNIFSVKSERKEYEVLLLSWQDFGKKGIKKKAKTSWRHAFAKG